MHSRRQITPGHDTVKGHPLQTQHQRSVFAVGPQNHSRGCTAACCRATMSPFYRCTDMAESWAAMHPQKATPLLHGAIYNTCKGGNKKIDMPSIYKEQLMQGQATSISSVICTSPPCTAAGGQTCLKAGTQRLGLACRKCPSAAGGSCCSAWRTCPCCRPLAGPGPLLVPERGAELKKPACHGLA